MLVTKQNLMENSCVVNSADDEPLFVLVARDRTAPEVVEFWARKAEVLEVNPEKVADAHEIATAMREWQTGHTSKIPD